MDEVARILERLEPDLGSPEGEPVVLSGGITNRNLKVRLGGEDYVLRICSKGTEAVSIDRATEVAATRQASEAGVAPAVVRWLEEESCLVTAFIPGTALTPDALREPARLAQIADSIRRVHAGPALATTFPTFTLVDEYAASVAARGGTVGAEDHRLASEVSRRVQAALAGPEHAPVPCHNDLLTANFIDDGRRVRIVDWEYAGMNDRYFDLGNMSVNNGLTEDDDHRLLEAYFAQPATPRRFAALRLMRLMSDVREGMWGAVQSVVSELDFDYRGYGAEHFARLRAAASDPRVEGWLRAASA